MISFIEYSFVSVVDNIESGESKSQNICPQGSAKLDNCENLWKKVAPMFSTSLFDRSVLYFSSKMSPCIIATFASMLA